MKFSKIVLPQVQHIIAIASGKGGVGKSTVAYNLAVGMAERGLKIGLLDADIYGPSLPLLTGQNKKPLIEEGKFVPWKVHGVHTISMGFLLEDHAPVMWRGPMLQTALRQFLKDVKWPDLDLLIIDMPPGTGDAHLTIAQAATLTGAILVTTPQKLALVDAIRCLKTFQTLKVPILGMIENMAGLECPHCHHHIDLFQGCISEFCEKEKIPYLGKIAFDPMLARYSDCATPLVMHKKSSIYGTYEGILDKIIDPFLAQ